MKSYKLPAFMQKTRMRSCFVCNVRLDSANYTLEHLIPQWMIRMFRLQDEIITFPSGRTVSYLDFVVPCCKECNCHLLSPIEASLARAMSRPDRNPENVPIDLFAIWVCKILTGSRVYWQALDETAATTDNQRRFISIGRFGKRRSRRIRTVLSGDMCKQYLRMLRGKVTFSALLQDFPFSLLIFRTKLPKKLSERFDFKIVHQLDAVYVRLGKWSILARSDGGYISLYGQSFFAPFTERKLAPLQVEELAAHFFTMAERQDHPLLFYTRQEDDTEVIEFINVTLNRPFYGGPDAHDFISWFALLTRIPEAKLTPGGHRWTFLKNDDGTTLSIPADRKNCFAS